VTTRCLVARCAKVKGKHDQCPADTPICEQGRLFTPLTALDLLPLPVKQARSIDFIPFFYWSARGQTRRYRVVCAPVLATSGAPRPAPRIVFSLLLAHRGPPQQRVVTVVGLYSQTRQPGRALVACGRPSTRSTSSVGPRRVSGSFSIGDPDKGRSFGFSVSSTSGNARLTPVRRLSASSFRHVQRNRLSPTPYRSTSTGASGHESTPDVCRWDSSR